MSRSKFLSVGDLSAFNILYDGEHPVIIDFPQAVRVSTHDEPYELFRRDVENVLSYFERYGIGTGREGDVQTDWTTGPAGVGATDAGRGRPPGGDRHLADELWERHYLPVRVR